MIEEVIYEGPEDAVEEDQETKFKDEKQMILDWLNDYEQRTAQLQGIRERLGFINGWLTAIGNEV